MPRRWIPSSATPRHTTRPYTSKSDKTFVWIVDFDTVATTYTPKAILSHNIQHGRKLVKIANGGEHSLGVDETGQLYAQGNCFHGALGNGTTESYVKNMTRVACDTKFKDVSAGHYVSAGIDTSGKVWTWGSNFSGELGQDSKAKFCVKPGLVQAALQDKVVKKISVGAHHMLALTDTGDIYAWGANHHGELGDGTTVDQCKPVPVLVLDATKYVDISAGTDFSLALTADGVIHAWGSNASGQLGNSTTESQVSTPRVLTCDTIFTQVAAGTHAAAGISKDSEVWTWGSNKFGILGLGREDSYRAQTPERVGGILSAVKITEISMDKLTQAMVGGAEYALALSDTGKVYSWGNCDFGQLGHGSDESSNTPIGPIQGKLRDKKCLHVSAGGLTAAAVTY